MAEAPGRCETIGFPPACSLSHHLSAATAGNQCMIATGNHVIYDSLRGAPLPEGAERVRPKKRETHRKKRFVILSEPAGESKNLRTEFTAAVDQVRSALASLIEGGGSPNGADGGSMAKVPRDA